MFERHDGIPGALRWLAPLSVSHTAMPRRHPILEHRKSRTSRNIMNFLFPIISAINIPAGGR